MYKHSTNNTCLYSVCTVMYKQCLYSVCTVFAPHEEQTMYKHCTNSVCLIMLVYCLYICLYIVCTCLYCVQTVNKQCTYSLFVHCLFTVCFLYKRTSKYYQKSTLFVHACTSDFLQCPCPLTHPYSSCPSLFSKLWWMLCCKKEVSVIWYILTIYG